MRHFITESAICELTGSAKAKFLNSQDNWNAVSNGSLEDRAISEGLASALYSFSLDSECLSESSSDCFIHSSQPHLKLLIVNGSLNRKNNLLLFHE